jgi:DNA-binding NarL/FixJ family response regulator
MSEIGAAIRVVLADDHAMVRAGVRRVLESRADVEVVAEVEDGQAAWDAIEHHAPDIVVLDLAMPRMTGLEVLRRAKAGHPAIRVIILTMHANREYLAQALQAGADSYLLKESAAHELLNAIDAVRAGRAYHSPRIQTLLTDQLRNRAAGQRTGLDLLTTREREVLREIAIGKSSREIAAALGIGSRTVESHRASLMRKLDLHSVALLTQFAIREGLVTP